MSTEFIMSEERKALFQFINLTGIYAKAEPLNTFLLKVQISWPAALSSNLISRSLLATWKPLALTSIIQLWFSTKILSSTIAHIVQTATWTPTRAVIFFSLYIFHPVSESGGCEQSCRLSDKRQRLQQSLGHLALLWGESLSAQCVRPLQTIATGYEPASAVRDELWSYKGGTVRQGGIGSVAIDEDCGGICWSDGGWDKGGRSADHHGLARWCRCWRENNRHWKRMIASNGVHASNKILKYVCYVGYGVLKSILFPTMCLSKSEPTKKAWEDKLG